MVHRLAASPDGKHVAVARGDGMVSVYDAKKMRSCAELAPHNYSVAAVYAFPHELMDVSGLSVGCISRPGPVLMRGWSAPCVC